MNAVYGSIKKPLDESDDCISIVVETRHQTSIYIANPFLELCASSALGRQAGKNNMTTRQDQSSSPPRPRRVYRRAAVACKSCHGRKVRCNVALSGSPCANCAADGIACEIGQRKRRINPDQLVITPDRQQDGRQSPLQILARREHGGDRVAVQSYPAGIQGSEFADSAGGRIPFPGSASASSRSGTSARAPDSWLYLGDENGLLGPTLNICHHNTYNLSGHVFMPVTDHSTLDPEDLQLLRRKGCFTLPPQEVQDALISAYFHYVYPLAPVIDVADFMYQYAAGHVSLLLLWSLFSAGASYIDEELAISKLGKTKLEIKAEAYYRAVSLYELGYEKETITLIQSTYLMSYRFGSITDLKGPWYWVGVAISLAYTAGLHRLSHSPDGPDAHPRLWAQIWWSFYCRDAWMSLISGRPMRIHRADVSTPLPSQVEVASVPVDLHNVHNVHNVMMDKYLPREINELVKLWPYLLRISFTLGNLLTTFYTPKSSGPTQQQVDLMEREIGQHMSELPSGAHASDFLTACVHQIRLYHEAIMIILYRPQTQRLQNRAPSKHQEPTKALCFRKMRASALRVTHLINMMISEGLTKHMHLLTIVAVIPSMQVHLFDLMSTDQPTRQAGDHNLHLYMVLLENIGTAHIAAQATHRMFKAAIGNIMNKPLASPFSPVTCGSGSEHRSTTDDETSLPAVGESESTMSTELSYLDLLPMLSPDADFSLDE
ncbi:hypothetical protein ED733_000899 [Metarhizium rileyi]|uniref:Zn(2)-C6 fungal-type domain-containing protein n=1 Tax=Metarhizium rileyi (strain RCEF 4871) TaxID=1649241 RepID=A0A5C6G468_METRR|nr:hypothetical protein ED733_000899 [Metarhizium rileyi]